VQQRSKTHLTQAVKPVCASTQLIPQGGCAVAGSVALQLRALQRRAVSQCQPHWIKMNPLDRFTLVEDRTLHQRGDGIFNLLRIVELRKKSHV